MIVSIHQPDYIPWLGLYYKIAHSDKFVYLDDAQYSNEAAHNFNVVKTAGGECRLKIPVKYEFGDLINTVTTRDELKWKDKHLKTIQLNYVKCPFFKPFFDGFSDIILSQHKSLADLNVAINRFICDGFEIKTEISKSSDLDINSVREQRVIDITLAVGGTEYLSGNGARVYQKEEHFENYGIKLSYLDYKPIIYPQRWGDFLPCMSAIDYIMNCGFDWEGVEKALKNVTVSENVTE